jgi:hypothetical protein
LRTQTEWYCGGAFSLRIRDCAASMWLLMEDVFLRGVSVCCGLNGRD